MDKQCNEILVSIFCAAYNHERFIEKALDGFVTQKTSFSFEVIVHDDASTDKTPDIIREYEKNYPDIIKPIYQSENLYSQGISIIKNHMLPKAKGKYIAWCEGDDFWCDPLKLQRQYDALEANPDCSACFSKVQFIDTAGISKQTFMPDLHEKDGVLSSRSFIGYTLFPGVNKTLPWQLSGLMARTEIYKNYIENPPPYKVKFKKTHVGDIPLFLFIGTKGNIYYLDKVMSYYRIDNPDSWAGRMYQNSNKLSDYYLGVAEAFEEFDESTELLYHEKAQKGIKNREFLAARVRHDIKAMKNKEYQEFYNQLSISERLKHYVFFFFPILSNCIKKIKRNVLRRWYQINQ